MKKLLIFILITAISHAQPSTVDQIRAKIQEINQLARSLPEIKPLLDEYVQLNTQLTELKRSTGLDNVQKTYLQVDKEICLAEEAEIGPLKEKRQSLLIRRPVWHPETQEINQVPPLSDPTKERRLQEIKSLDQEILSRGRSYMNKMIDNERFKTRKFNELGGEKNRAIRKKIEQLDQKIYLEITRLKPQSDALYEELGHLRGQIAEETPCILNQILEETENLLYLQ